MTLAFRNARLALPDRIATGTLEVRDGRISSVDGTPAAPADAVDLDGDFLMPGLIDLHTDNIEQHYQPRPNVYWDPVAAAVNHDGQIAAAGITTVFDAVCLGLADKGELRAAHLRPLVGGIADAKAAGMLRVDHRVHLRCEVTGAAVLDQLAGFDDDPLVGMVSVMDHAPGQRQTADVEIWYRLRRENDGLPEAVIQAEFERLTTASREDGPGRRRAVASWACERRLALASHDDQTLDHVAESAGIGCTIAEFPTTVAAARACAERGIAVMMGGPNLVRGRSSYGNVTARALAEDGLLDLISSDYVPASLLHAAFVLGTSVAGWTLARAIAAVTANPADAAGLADRGRLAPGRRADLIRVRVVDGRPLVRGVWVAGARVA